MTIKGKVLKIILSTSLSAVLFVSVACVVSLWFIHALTGGLSEKLGETAAEDSRAAIENQVKNYIETFAVQAAERTDEKFRDIQSKTKLIAMYAEDLFRNSDYYKSRYIGYLTPEEEGTLTPSVMTAPGLGLDNTDGEIGIAANISGLIQGIAAADDEIEAAHLSLDDGYIILVQKNSLTRRQRNFDPRGRSWYREAKKTGLKGARQGALQRAEEVFSWTLPYMHIQGTGSLITCSLPFYKYYGNSKEFAGVAGISLSLAAVDRFVNSVKAGKTGYAFLLSDSGSVVTSPRARDVSTDEAGNIKGFDYLNSENQDERELARRMTGGENGIMELETDGRKVFAAYCPLKTVKWSFAVVVPQDEVTEPVRIIQDRIMSFTDGTRAKLRYTMLVILIVIFAVILAAAFTTVFIAEKLAKSFTAPIKKLSMEAHIIGEGNLEHKLEVKTGDEIEELAGIFNGMIENIKKITSEKQRINSELGVAFGIQMDMLPDVYPRFSGNEHIDLYAKMMPAREVGGDFYDFFYIDKAETRICLVVADVSGKGVPAALFMVISKTLIKQEMLRHGNPALALEQTNRILSEDNPRNMFVTAFIAAIDLVTGKMVYANGGHNPPLFSASGAPYRFLPLKRGVPPGVMADSTYTVSVVRLRDGDRLYLYTDGINEAMNSERQMFGNAAFLKAANNALGLPPREFDEAVRQAVAEFTCGAEQSDDITTVAVVFYEAARMNRPLRRGPRRRAGRREATQDALSSIQTSGRKNAAQGSQGRRSGNSTGAGGNQAD